MSKREDLAVMLVTKQYSGTAWVDWDVWAESVTEDERDDALETANAIIALLEDEPDESGVSVFQDLGNGSYRVPGAIVSPTTGLYVTKTEIQA